MDKYRIFQKCQKGEPKDDFLCTRTVIYLAFCVGIYFERYLQSFANGDVMVRKFCKHNNNWGIFLIST